MLVLSFAVVHRDNLTDLWVHDPHIECGTQLHFAVVVPDERNDLEAVVSEHQGNVLLVWTQEQWVWGIPRHLVLLLQVSF